MGLSGTLIIARYVSMNPETAQIIFVQFQFLYSYFSACMRRYFGQSEKGVFCKTAMEQTSFYRIFRSYDVLTWHAAVCGDGGGDGHISSIIWNFLQAEMRKKGFQKPWQILGSRYSQTDASNGACGSLMTASCSCCSWNKPAKNLQHPCFLEKLDPTAENALYVASQRSVKTVTSLLCCAGFAQTCDGTLAQTDAALFVFEPNKSPPPSRYGRYTLASGWRTSRSDSCLTPCSATTCFLPPRILSPPAPLLLVWSQSL